MSGRDRLPPAPREPRLRISIRAGVVLELRLDHLLRVEGFRSGRTFAPAIVRDGITVELIETLPSGAGAVVHRAHYTPADFPEAPES